MEPESSLPYSQAPATCTKIAFFFYVCVCLSVGTSLLILSFINNLKISDRRNLFLFLIIKQYFEHSL